MTSDVICKGFNLGYTRMINTPSYPVDMEDAKIGIVIFPIFR